MKPLRIVFMGTPDFILPVLEVLSESGHELVCIYTQPPRPKGRGHKLEPSPAHRYGEEHGIPVRTPANFKDERDVREFEALEADVAVVAAFGMLLPDSVLNAPKHGCLNVHPSLLPRWRGPSPIQYAIWKGDAETGVSVIRLIKKMDAGPIIAQKKVSVRPQSTFESLNSELWALGAAMMHECLNRLANDGELQEEPQSEEGVTYCKLLSREAGRIDWSQSAQDIDRQIRALNPWPGVWTEMDGRRVKILEAAIAEPASGQAGTLLDRKGHVSCGDGTAIRLLRIQPHSAKAMDAPSAVNGGYLEPGRHFS